ncbi:YqiA/YcfP family alpha/beta fold hydrolase [Snodgrassella sp. CFCC 13594]|uniref:YqiA/YcfP family alpha/beta fold hydrolase n=1 Tax=Snodgrassella sp. CFCC 13594 TaxID=1775559 RepID=UPI000A5CAB75|nr:YqiA/YcfP family alpha/beta fold hydrolase [Snodgrassella sp. CFCC 13594]
MRPNLYYLCGYQSHSTQSPKYAYIQAAFADCMTITPLDYPGSYDAQQCWNAFTQQVDTSQPSVFMGSSLGGFWALHLANHYACPCMLLNPCCRPSLLAKKAHAHAQDAPLFEAFTAWERIQLHPQLARLVFLAKDDAVLDYREAMRDLPHDTEWVIYPSGGHTLWPKLPAIENRSRLFLQEQALI